MAGSLRERCGEILKRRAREAIRGLAVANPVEWRGASLRPRREKHCMVYYCVLGGKPLDGEVDRPT